MASSGTGKALNVCPTNVKEALEWLVEVAVQGPSGVAQIIKNAKIIEGLDGKEAQELCQKAEELCQKTREFLSAIRNGGTAQQTYKTNGWSTMCQDAAKTGTKCCGGTSGCSCQASQGNCKGCCDKCPKQICARIFCLIVPVVAYTLKYLLDKCDNKNGAWKDHKLNNGDNGKTELKEFMVACGFDASQLNGNKKGEDLTGRNSPLDSLGGALWSIKGAIETALQNDKNDASKNFLKDASKTSQKQPPSSLTDLLLWLQFLPYCLNYHEVIEAVKKKINGNDKEKFVQYLKESISELPMLFLQIEGKGERHSSSPVHGSSLFLKISELSKCQYIFDQKYYDKDNVVKMLLCVFPVIHWGLKALKDRCTNGSCNKTIENCNDTKNLLTSLGWNGSKESQSVSDYPPIIHENAKCQSLKDYLTNYFLGTSTAMAKMKEILEGAWKADNASSGSVSPSTTSGSHLPRTIYEMLIWLMGLPVSGVFKDLKSEIQKQNGGTLAQVMPQFTGILFQLPHLFLTLNGDLSGLLGNMYNFQGIGNDTTADKQFKYGSTGFECLKIFSAIVAILFPVIRYLQQRCMNGGSVFANGDSWQNKQTNAPALKDFLVFMGFGPTISDNNTMQGSAFHEKVLKEIFGDLTQQNGSQTEKLNKLYDVAKNKLEGESSKGTTPPTTIRQMMLWLIGLPVTTAYKSSGTSPPGPAAGTGALFGEKGPVVAGINQNQALMKLEQPSVTRGRTVSAATGKHFKQQLKDSIVGMIMLFQRIEGSVQSVLEFLKGGFKDTNGGGSSGAAQGNGKFKYEGFSGDESLLNVFSSYVYKVHTQLRFLKVMCKTEKANGGWKECYYTDTSGSGVGDKITCGCSYSDPCCALPLKHFLTNNGNNNGGSGANGNKFKLCDGSNEKYAMGFDAKHLTKNGSKTGYNIYTYLEQLLDPIPTTATQPSSQSTPSSKPLSLLTQYCVAIGRIDPSSLGDHFDVFRELANGMWTKIEQKVKGELGGITKKDANGETASGALHDALKAVWPTGHNGKHDGDLMSLTGCNGGTCSPFVASLSHGLYQYFDPTKLRSPANKIDWLYMKMSALYGKLTTLKKEMESKCKCCPEGEASKECKGIIQCPNCLPLMYKMGLVFGDPSELTTGNKSCRDLMDMMEKVLEATTSKLCVIFTSIEDGRFKPYLLFSSHVVKGKNGQLQGDEYMKRYTIALDAEYTKYLNDKKKTDTQKAENNKQARDNALKCTCKEHSYTAPTAVPGTATTVTLTLYFHKDGVTTIQLLVPHHGPTYNPLVRFYPRNLKSIVDWLLRIGQTRLGQETSAASMDELCKTFWPRIETHLTVKDENCKDVFQQLVEGVVKLMGLENKGKDEVSKEVEKEYDKAKEKLKKKLNGGGEGFATTFNSILTFKPKQYIDAVITDFGKKVCNVTTNGLQKNRSYWCIAKAVSTCMSTALETIKKLAKQNKNEMDKYSVSDIEELSGTDITSVSSLDSIEQLKKLCDGFQKFHEVYKKVKGAFNDHLNTAQKNGAWSNINKCVEAFNELGECAKGLGELSSYGDASKMQDASTKLEEISKKLKDVHEKLNENDIQTFTEKVTEFIKQLDEALEGDGKTKLETALQINNGGSKTFDELLKSYVSNVIQEMKNNTNNTVYDIYLRVRNDLQQLSECLKVMCEVCSTGMKDFAEKLKECVEKGKGHLDKINALKKQLEELKSELETFNGGNKSEYENNSMKEKLQMTITTIEGLLSNHYIYNPQPIVNTLIDNTAVQKMTTYLKSLPDLIRDRYVLQKWTDGPEVFCGVQKFKGGIVKNSDIKGIEEKLQELLKEAFHSDAASDITIHEFQVRAVIYNCCHKEGIRGIDSGIKVMSDVTEKINDKVEWDKIKDNKELNRVVNDISGNAYLRYFATHLRDSIGYHTLSNTLGALEQVKEKLKESNGSQPQNWNEISKLLHQKTIEDLYKHLSSLVAQLYKEYIFEYPPFDWQKSCKRLVEQNKGSRARRAAGASPDPSQPVPNYCEMCAPSMAHIFIGFVPQMYRLFKMLHEMTEYRGYGHEHTLVFDNNGRDKTKKTMNSLAGLLSREGWRLKLGSGTSSGDQAFDLDASKTGADVYEKVKDIIGDTAPGALVAQGEASTADSLKPLDRLFKAVMQHFRRKRNERKTERERKEREALDAIQQRTNSGLKFVPPPPVLPSTVREVLFWLHELDTKGDFYNAMSLHMEALCTAASPTVTISHDTILHVLKLSASQALEVLATIEDPGRQNADYYYELYTEEHYYAYPVTNIPLFFYTFVEKLMGAFLELNFVCVQCEFGALEGGWKDCEIGKAHQGAYEVQGSVCCICHERKTVGTPIHAVTVSGSVVCPRPLYSFLFSDQKNQLKVPTDPNHRLPYMSKRTMPCGFQLKNKAITDPATGGDAHAHTAPTPAPTSVSGSVLVEPLRKLVGGHVTGRHGSTTTNGLNTLNTVIYLRDLLRYVLCLAVRPPWSMSENMAFFYRVTESWKQKDKKGVRSVAQRNAELLGAIHAEIDLFPGTFEASLLTSAVERFAGLEDNKHQKSKTSGASNGHHQYDLRTLMGCQETNTPGTIGTTAQCSTFMFPLSLDVYTHYDHRNSRAYLSWILNFAFGIYGQLRGLEEMMQEKECVRNASQSASNYPSLPMCPGVLTALYQSGSSFMDQGKLAEKKNNAQQSRTNTTKKTCAHFRDVLSGLFNCDSAYCTPLHNLIVQCEAFLWSIRLPFSLVQLSLWSVAILFISYVFVVPLDHFKIKSHLFNRLKYTMHPSLLIADGQRRVSEVAYFSL